MCGSAACRKTLRTVTSVVTHARMFTAKPDGDVNIFMLQARPQPCRRTMLRRDYMRVHQRPRVCTGGYHGHLVRPLLRLLTLRHAGHMLARF